MTLDEAIAKAKADGDVQLAEWLRQARGADAAAKWYTEKLRDAHRTIRKLLNENAKLRELGKCMAKALRVGSGWCNRDCADEFGCDLHGCPIEASMRELGIGVDA